MQRVPDEIEENHPHADADQRRPRGICRPALRQRIKTEHAENEDGWRRERELGRDHLAEIFERDALDAGAAKLLDERYPFMIRIPQDHRREDRESEDAAEIRPWRRQPAALVFHQQKPQQNLRAEEQRGVFREQPASHRNADCEPPHATARLPHLGETKENEARRHHQWRVRRHDGGADRRHQRRIEEDSRRRRDARVIEQDPGGAIDRPAHRQREQDRDQPHTELRIAGDHDAQADHHGDHRGVIVVTARKMFRPSPVIGFVEGQRRDGRSNQAKHHKRGHGDDRAANQLRLRGSHFARQTKRLETP